MPITLTHLSGPLKGQQRRFGDDRERIVIGRDASKCDIVYPADLTVVGREHCALVRELSGDYALDVFGEHYAEMDGEPAQDGTPVRSGKTLTLGRRDGPCLKAEIEHADAGDLAATTAQQAAPSLWKSEHRTRVLAAAAVLLALIAGGGYLWQSHQLVAERERTAALVGQMSALVTAQKAEAETLIAPEARRHLSEAVYAVVLRDSSGNESLLGTAWGVAPDKLATNAHVAVEFAKVAAGGSLVVRPSGAGKTGFTVKSVTIHPGYAAFDSFVNDDSLLVKNYNGWQLVSSIDAYDAALLNIDGTLPPDAILQLADEAELKALTPGSPLAFAGYPYEGVSGATVQPLGRSSIVQVGNMTGATDYFFLPAPFDERYLVGHNLPSTGGASGSPIIDAQNHVVALLSSGNINVVDKRRTPSAVQINYGQRVDVLRDLLDDQAAERLKADRSYWTKQTSAFARGADVVIDGVIDSLKPDRATKASLLAGVDFKIGTENRFNTTDAAGKPQTIRYKLVNLDLIPGSHHLVIAYGKGLTPIAAISLIEDGNVVDRKAGRGAWAALDFKAPAKGKQLAVLVEMADADIDLVIRDYVWEPSAM